jgi:hypothetical protein
MLGVNRVGSGVARGLDIMMPEAIDLKFIAALLTGNQIKGGKSRVTHFGIPVSTTHTKQGKGVNV